MLNIDDMALVVDGATMFLQGIPEEEMTDRDKRMRAAVSEITRCGMAAEEDLPVDKITKRRGDWIQTRHGRRFFVFDPLASDIDPEDVSYGLANTTRFGGQSPFYPVSVHTIRVANISEVLAKRRGADEYTVALIRAYCMVHDGSEAYTPDVQRPIKRSMPRFREMEALVMRSVNERFMLPPPPPEVLEVVKMADELALLIEAEEMFPDTYHLWPVAERPHAELDAEVREAARLATWIEERLEVIRENIEPLRQHLHKHLQIVLEWTEKEGALKVLPEEQESSGKSSWRDEIRVSVDVNDPYALPEHLQKRIDKEEKDA